MTGAYTFWVFRTGEFGFQLSSSTAFVLTLVAMAVFGVVIELTIFRRLRNTAPLAKPAASLGLLLVLQSGVIVIFSSEPNRPRRTCRPTRSRSSAASCRSTASCSPGS